jgi:hypothetical protein
MMRVELIGFRGLVLLLALVMAEASSGTVSALVPAFTRKSRAQSGAVLSPSFLVSSPKRTISTHPVGIGTKQKRRDDVFLGSFTSTSGLFAATAQEVPQMGSRWMNRWRTIAERFSWPRRRSVRLLARLGLGALAETSEIEDSVAKPPPTKKNAVLEEIQVRRHLQKMEQEKLDTQMKAQAEAMDNIEERAQFEQSYQRQKQEQTRLKSAEQREAVFSPRHNVLSNGNIRVIFENGYLYGTGCPVLNSALAQCEPIRHVAIRPSTLVLNDGEIPFTANPHIESLLIRMLYQTCNPRQVLEGVKQNPTIKQLYLEHSGWSSCLAERNRLLLLVVPGHQSLVQVKISADVKDDLFAFWDELVSLLAEIRDEIYSIKFCHFSIEVLDDRKKTIPDKKFQEWWDTNMVPILVLNWYRNEPGQSQIAHKLGRKRLRDPVPRLVREPCLALKVLDVNRGTVYYRVSVYAPSSDMTIANASILFRMIRDYFR